jgi:hypothetical protein
MAAVSRVSKRLLHEEPEVPVGTPHRVPKSSKKGPVATEEDVNQQEGTAAIITATVEAEEILAESTLEENTPLAVGDADQGGEKLATPLPAEAGSEELVEEAFKTAVKEQAGVKQWGDATPDGETDVGSEEEVEEQQELLEAPGSVLDGDAGVPENEKPTTFSPLTDVAIKRILRPPVLLLHKEQPMLLRQAAELGIPVIRNANDPLLLGARRVKYLYAAFGPGGIEDVPGTAYEVKVRECHM